MSMVISLDGLMRRTAEVLSHNGYQGRAFDIRQLLKNLTELRDRKAEGEKILDEFFALYVLPETAAVGPPRDGGPEPASDNACPVGKLSF